MLSFPRLFVATLLLTTLPAAQAFAQPLAKPSEPAPARQLRDMLDAAFSADGPGASVLVARGGKTIFAGARGMADIAAKRTITADTPFYLGSITKTFTAALILKLVEEGKLSLEDPVSKHVPGFTGPAAQATVRQMLNHNSGLMDYSKIPGFIPQNRDKTFTTAALLDVIKRQPAVAAPGAKWEYNNAGYVLLGAIAEKVTGQSWPEALKSRITGPLNLTLIQPPATEGRTASSYSGFGARAERVVNGPLSIAGASGMLEGNAVDLGRFADALHQGTLLRPDLYRLMVSPAPMSDGTTMPYGFGLRLGQLLGARAYYQGGALRGGRTETLYLPEQDLFVAVLTNSDEPQVSPRELALRLAAAAMGQPFPEFSKAAMPIDKIRPLLGRYVDRTGRERLLFERGGKVWLAAGDAPAREVFAAGGNRYYFGGGELAWFKLVRDPAGKSQMVVHVPETSEPRMAMRTGDVPAEAVMTPAMERLLAGSYLTETGVTLVIAGGEGGLTVRHSGQIVGALRSLSGGQFAIDGTPMRLEFVREGDRVTGLRLFRGARILKAERKN